MNAALDALLYGVTWLAATALLYPLVVATIGDTLQAALDAPDPEEDSARHMAPTGRRAEVTSPRHER